MRKCLKIMAIYFILLGGFTGIVSSDTTTAPLDIYQPVPAIKTPATIIDPGSGILIPQEVMLPEDADTTEHRIFARGDCFFDSAHLDGRYRGQSRILSYSLGTGNGAAGTNNNNTITIVKHMDASSSRLARAGITGEHLREVELTVLKSLDPEEKLLRVKLTDFQVDSYNLIVTNDDPENALEEIRLRFGRIEYEQTVYSQDGTPMPNTNKFIYDYKANRFIN